MFIDDTKKHFYQFIKSRPLSRVLIFVSYDVDAIAGCKILQSLFEADNIQYTIIPISTMGELVKNYREHSERVKIVLLLNIGAQFDVISCLRPDSDVTVFIADSHRAIDVYNIYRDQQIRIITYEKENNIEDIPKYEDVFRDDEEEEEEEDINIRELSLEQLEQRTARQAWSKKRQRLLFEYTQFSYYSYSTALVMFDLAWKLSKDNNELLWLAIVGVCDQLMTGRINTSQYTDQCKYLHESIKRLKNTRGDGRIVLNSINDEQNDSQSLTSQNNNLNIVYEKDLQLTLYRHWSIYDSLRHTMYVACKFKIWKLRGHKHLLGFLAKVGLPLSQCKQKFSSMDLELRNNVKQWIADTSSEFALGQIIGWSFNASRGYKTKLNSCDVAHATRALLESADKDKRNNQKFFDAVDCLSWRVDLLHTGVDLAKIQFTAILKQLQVIIDTRQIVSQHSLWHVTLPDNMPDSDIFSHPWSIHLLAKFLLHAHASANPRSQSCYELPLVLIVPNVYQPAMAMAVGIPPLAADSLKNFFSKAFSQIGRKINNCVIEPDLVDSCVVHFPYCERNNFLNELSHLLT